MRISELSRASGVSIPTLKFYLREGLLMPGEPTAPNQAEYSDRHLGRLRLIRTLTEIGDLRLSEVHKVLEAIDDEDLGVHEQIGAALYALGPPPDPDPVPEDELRARAEVDAFLAERRWRVSPEAPARRSLAHALTMVRRLRGDADVRMFEPYARVADRVAAREIGTAPRGGSPAEAVEWAVVGTVVFEAALVALRRLAQEHHSSLRFQASGRRRA